MSTSILKRNVSPKSLENLKLGGQARNQNKKTKNLTLLPETAEWLEAQGNASQAVDKLVADAQCPTDPALGEKLEKAQQLLQEALALKPNAGGAIKAKIRLALELLA